MNTDFAYRFCTHTALCALGHLVTWPNRQCKHTMTIYHAANRNCGTSSTKKERTKGSDDKSAALGERSHEIKSIIEINEISENCPDD